MSLDFYLIETRPVDVFWRNTTHNHGKHADAVGVYTHLWHPNELGITKAHQLIEPLSEAARKLRANPEQYRQYDAKNGWGTVEHFTEFVEGVLQACIDHPDADIAVSA